MPQPQPAAPQLPPHQVAQIVAALQQQQQLQLLQQPPLGAAPILPALPGPVDAPIAIPAALPPPPPIAGQQIPPAVLPPLAALPPAVQPELVAPLPASLPPAAPVALLAPALVAPAAPLGQAPAAAPPPTAAALAAAIAQVLLQAGAHAAPAAAAQGGAAHPVPLIGFNHTVQQIGDSLTSRTVPLTIPELHAASTHPAFPSQPVSASGRLGDEILAGLITQRPTSSFALQLAGNPNLASISSLVRQLEHLYPGLGDVPLLSGVDGRDLLRYSFAFGLTAWQLSRASVLCQQLLFGSFEPVLSRIATEVGGASGNDLRTLISALRTAIELSYASYFVNEQHLAVVAEFARPQGSVPRPYLGPYLGAYLGPYLATPMPLYRSLYSHIWASI